MPLVLLDSFKTHETTAKIIRKYRMHNLTIHTFMQSCHPRIIKASEMDDAMSIGVCIDNVALSRGPYVRILALLMSGASIDTGARSAARM